MTLIFGKQLKATPTPIPGVVLFDLPVHGDNRGWFKENWQREKLLRLGLPDFGPVQNNISFNRSKGTTRGIHAEPWDKFISVASGRIFGAWVDLREGETFGAVFTTELEPSQAIFVPRGVGNGFQTLDDETVYTYLVNDHWSAAAQGEYTYLNAADEAVAIKWPIPLEFAELSEKDRDHPRLAEVKPMPPKKVLVLGGDGQVGRALREVFADDSNVEFARRQDLDLTDSAALDSVPWREYRAVINAAAYTAVDEAETKQGRRAAWEVNASAVSRIAAHSAAHQLVLVHISSDYVFDGSRASYAEDDVVNPLGIYGQTKAAGDLAVASVSRHYIVRTSWVIGDGQNFVRTIASLGERGVRPSVVNDQIGRLSFARDIAEGIRHLLQSDAPYGTYNLTNDGTPQSWAEIARDVFEVLGYDRSAVSSVSTQEYYKGKPAAPRPARSVLALEKIKSTGFEPAPMRERLQQYLSN